MEENKLINDLNALFRIKSCSIHTLSKHVLQNNTKVKVNAKYIKLCKCRIYYSSLATMSLRSNFWCIYTWYTHKKKTSIFYFLFLKGNFSLNSNKPSQYKSQASDVLFIVFNSNHNIRGEMATPQS